MGFLFRSPFGVRWWFGSVSQILRPLLLLFRTCTRLLVRARGFGAQSRAADPWDIYDLVSRSSCLFENAFEALWSLALWGFFFGSGAPYQVFPLYNSGYKKTASSSKLRRLSPFEGKIKLVVKDKRTYEPTNVFGTTIDISLPLVHKSVTKHGWTRVLGQPHHSVGCIHIVHVHSNHGLLSGFDEKLLMCFQLWLAWFFFPPSLRALPSQLSIHLLLASVSLFSLFFDAKTYPHTLNSNVYTHIHYVFGWCQCGITPRGKSGSCSTGKDVRSTPWMLNHFSHWHQSPRFMKVRPTTHKSVLQVSLSFLPRRVKEAWNGCPKIGVLPYQGC